MRRAASPVVLWLTATAASIAIASAAIAQVGRQVISDAPVDERLAQAARPDEDPTDLPPGGGDDAGTISDGPTAPSAPEVRTYESIGGRAAIDVADGSLDVRWATPNVGFRVDVERAPDGRELRVEFRSDAHRSRINLEFEDGELEEEIDEDDRT